MHGNGGITAYSAVCSFYFRRHQTLPAIAWADSTAKALYLKFDGEALSENIQKQMPILNQLGRSVSERSQLMRKLGLPCNETSVNRIFNALPAKIGTQARKQWTLLESLVKQCQQDNQSNGQSSAAFQELVSQLKQPVQHTYEERSF